MDCQALFTQDQSQALLVLTAPRGTEGYEKIQLLGVVGRQTFPLAERGATARFVQADVGDVASAQSAVQAAVDEFGRVDCLVNSAGLTSRGTLLDTTPELFDSHVAVNLRGPYFTMQAAVRDMVRRKAPGTVVNVISIAELGGQPYLSPYVAAKAGLAGATRHAVRAAVGDLARRDRRAPGNDGVGGRQERGRGGGQPRAAAGLGR